MGAKHVVIDALDVLMRLVEDDRRKQDELTALHQWLSERAVTAVLSAKAPRDGDHARHYEFLDYLADCVIHLDNRVVGQLSTRRLRVVKFRGSGFGSNEYPFVIDVPGITLLPISEVGLSHQELGDRVSTGLAALDELLSGGFRRSSSVLLTGSTGTGKTTLCSVFAQAACARGESVLYLSFEESEAALLSAMQSPGIDLRPAVESGRLRIVTAMPESMGAEQHLMCIFAGVREIRPAFVVLESASACKRMGTEQAAFEFLMRLINGCKEMGITIIITNQAAGFQNLDEISGIGISSLIDTVIALRLVERDDVLRRRLIVMKARGSQHSQRYHDFRITDRGVVIGGGDA
ncbi:MAG TPA: ATPase domain-containing protein [Rhodocyclaceae bacterium]